MRPPRVAPRSQVPPAPSRHQPPAKASRAMGRHLGVAAGLMAACCGVHLLLTAGILAALGGWFVAHSLVVAVEAVAVTMAAAVGWRRWRRGGSSLRCPVVDSDTPGDTPAPPGTSPPERPGR